jgi:uncharacterized protein (TIGR03437 family)
MLRRIAVWTALGALLVALAVPALAVGPPASLVAVTPAVQNVSPGGMVTLAVQVLDAASAPVASTTVTFTTSGLTFLTPQVVVSDASGYAQVMLSAPVVTGLYYAYAWVGGVAPLTFMVNVTGIITGTSGIVPVVSTTQNVLPGGTVSVAVRVVDVFGNPVSNATVSFSSTPGLTFLSSQLVLADSNGYAQATLSTPYSIGVYYVYVSVAGLNPVTFTINVGTTGGGGVGGISIVSGNGQVVPQYFPAPKDLVVVVRDTTTGMAQAGALVNWAVASNPGPTLGSTQTFTDVNGRSSISVFGTSIVPASVPYIQSMITASTSTGTVNFFLTTLPNVAPGVPGFLSAQLITPETRLISGQVGQTLPGAIQVRAAAVNAVIPNVGLEVSTGNDPSLGPTASCAGGVPLSDATGLVTCDVVLGGKLGEAQLTLLTGGANIQTLMLRVTIGSPATIRIIQGDNQTTDAGKLLPLALVGEVADAGGNILVGAPVQWEVQTAGMLVLTAPTTTVSDYNGRASTRVTAGQTPGVHRVLMKSGNALATFTITVNVVIASLQKVSGDGQTALINQPFGQPVVVQVRDAQNNAVPGVTVAFSASGGGVLGAASAITDAQGRAQTTVQAGATAGTIVVTATVGSLPAVTFTLTARLPGPSLTAASFLNGAGFQPGVVAGGVVAIVAAGLAPGITDCVSAGTISGPLPTRLAGVEVFFGATAAPIYSVCNRSGQEQVTVQAPFDMPPGPVMVTVRVSGGASVVNDVRVLAAQPGIFEYLAADGRRYAVAIRADGSFTGPDNMALRTEIVRVFMTGLGPVLPLAATNRPGVGGQKVYYPVIVGVNGKGVRVESAEYAENMIGVYVVAFEIPVDASSGREISLDVGVSTAEGQPLVFSNTARISIQ